MSLDNLPFLLFESQNLFVLAFKKLKRAYLGWTNKTQATIIFVFFSLLICYMMQKCPSLRVCLAKPEMFESYDKKKNTEMIIDKSKCDKLACM